MGDKNAAPLSSLRQGLRSANETLDQIQKSLEDLRIIGRILRHREHMNEDIDILWFHHGLLEDTPLVIFLWKQQKKSSGFPTKPRLMKPDITMEIWIEIWDIMGICVGKWMHMGICLVAKYLRNMAHLVRCLPCRYLLNIVNR